MPLNQPLQMNARDIIHLVHELPTKIHQMAELEGNRSLVWWRDRISPYSSVADLEVIEAA